MNSYDDSMIEKWTKSYPELHVLFRIRTKLQNYGYTAFCYTFDEILLYANVC